MFNWVEAEDATPAIWIIRRVLSGWNSWGATCWVDVNRLTFAQAQVEFIPGDSPTCYRIRYDSVPFLPIHPRYIRILSTLVTMAGGRLHATPCPKTLAVACERSGTLWTASVTTTEFLVACQEFAGLDDVQSPAAFAAVLADNFSELQRFVVDGVNPAVISRLVPAPNKRSIFDNDLGAWGAWMGGFAYDDCGRISVGRALASLPVLGYIGTCDDVMRWKLLPSVFKIPNGMTTGINHRLLDVDNHSLWPNNPLYYNPTPQLLNLYIASTAGIPPTMLAMPITAVVSNAPQVKTYGSFSDRVTISVYMATTPVVVFSSVAADSNIGFPGESMEKLIPKLEAAFVRGFLVVFHLLLTAVKSTPVPSHFHIRPTADSTARNPDVTVVVGDSVPTCINTEYMSQDDNLISLFTGTPSSGEVRVDGITISSMAAEGIKTNYPRAHLTGIPISHIAPGDKFSANGNRLGSGRAPTVDAFLRATRTEAVAPHADVRRPGTTREAPAAAAPPPRGGGGARAAPAAARRATAARPGAAPAAPPAAAPVREEAKKEEEEEEEGIIEEEMECDISPTSPTYEPPVTPTSGMD